jgi:hypothetical protein
VKGAQHVEGAWEGELRGALTLQGVDATAATGLFHGAQDPVRRGESSGQACGADSLACDDAVAVKETFDGSEVASGL